MSIVGRERELASLRGRAVGEPGARALVLVGEPGIGKTTLWEAGVAAARSRRVRVMAARPGESEARLPFAGLIDICERLGAAELADLPAPQRRALEGALLRADPAAGSVHAGAVEFGFGTAVRGLAAGVPLVIAVDDLQWLDRSSADVLAFAARRVGDARIGFLLARRPGRATELERVLERGSVARIEVGALTLGAVRRMLRERLGLTISRPLLRRVVEVTQGNPLFALEIGRLLLEQAVAAADADGSVSCEFVEAFAKPYPSLVIAHVMGAPLDDAPRLHQWSNWIQRQFDANSLLTEREQIERNVEEFYAYADQLIEQRQRDPAKARRGCRSPV